MQRRIARSVGGRAKAVSTETSQFDELVVSLASAFVKIKVDQIDAEINHWLKNIVLALGMDRSTIAEINAENALTIFSYGWAREPEH